VVAGLALLDGSNLQYSSRTSRCSNIYTEFRSLTSPMNAHAVRQQAPSNAGVRKLGKRCTEARIFWGMRNAPGTCRDFAPLRADCLHVRRVAAPRGERAKVAHRCTMAVRRLCSKTCANRFILAPMAAIAPRRALPRQGDPEGATRLAREPAATPRAALAALGTEVAAYRSTTSRFRSP
jgi:hypothetical protein